MGEVLKEKGSIPLGEKLYNNINNENVIGYDELIKKSIPGIDLDGMYVITDKSDIKLDESQQLGDQPQTLGGGQSAPEQSENNEQNHDPNQQTPDQQNQTQGKGKAKRRIPIKLGRLPNAARVLALATGLVVAASGVYFAFTSGVGQAIIATLANTNNLVGMGTVMGATLKAK